MHITFITESQQSNSLGRTYCLWLLAQHLGWQTTILTVGGAEVWRPLTGTEFANDIVRVEGDQLTRHLPPETTLIVACKPLPNSLGLAVELTKATHKPLLLDIDDPDLEIRMRSGNAWLGLARWVRHPVRSWVDFKNRSLARRLPTLTSNPWLQARYGGALIPHARPDLGTGANHESRDLRIVFVGSVHAHKGVDLLRDAVAALRDEGATLTMTADTPVDARPWERWIGQTSLEEGLELARDADIIALPSLRRRNAVGQLPAKLIDAMLFGRAVIVSDVQPMPWAVSEGGLVVPAGELTPLVAAIRSLKDPRARERLGSLARARALEQFTVEALAPRFADACDAAIMASVDAP